MREFANSSEQKVKKLYGKLIQGVRDLLAGGQLAQYLEFLSSSREYSLSNTLLIFRQRPDATMVAGIKTWNSVGRRVREGEKA